MERFIIVALVLFFYVLYRLARSKDKPRAAEHLTVSGRTSFPFSELTSDPRFPQIRRIHTKVRGVSKTNADGSDRQKIIRTCCHPGDALYCVREPTNPVDPNAIQVRRVVRADMPDQVSVGEQIGYLSRELAEEFACRMDEDHFVLMAETLDITGAEYGNLGVNIELSVYMPELKRKARKRAHPLDSNPRVTDHASKQ